MSLRVSTFDDVSRFLLTKAKARDVPVSKRAFRDPELAHRANYQYDRLQDTIRVREDFVPIDEALQALYDLVEKLGIPEQ